MREIIKVQLGICWDQVPSKTMLDRAIAFLYQALYYLDNLLLIKEHENYQMLDESSFMFSTNDARFLTLELRKEHFVSVTPQLDK